MRVESKMRRNTYKMKLRENHIQFLCYLYTLGLLCNKIIIDIFQTEQFRFDTALHYVAWLGDIWTQF